MVTVKLSELMHAMADGGRAVFLSKGCVAERASAEDAAQIKIPQVSIDKLYTEFLEMQHFPNEMLAKFKIEWTKGELLFPDKATESSWDSAFSQAAFEMLEQYEYTLVVSNYMQMRIAGLARAWASQNGLDLEEDFWNSNI